MKTIANRYKIKKSIAKGGMGDIVSCKDLHLDRDVVMKTLHDGVDINRLIDEQRALAKLRSKHVVQLYDIVTIPSAGKSYPAIIIEFIDGENLSIGTCSVDEQYFHTIWQIACGLADIHAAGIVHRDIKPSNIRRDKEGIIKILDFGLSRSNEDALTHSVIGTPIFMAPELWKNNAISFNSAIDVYAFSITCLTLLSKTIPPSLTNRPPTQPSWNNFLSYFSNAPIDIIKLLYQSLDSDPSTRPNINEICNALARHILKDRHRATVIMDGKIHTLDCNNRKITLNANIGSLVINYDGLDFKVTSASGSVFINNSNALVGQSVPGCCVLTFGTGNNRRFVTFDISNPEVMP